MEDKKAKQARKMRAWRAKQDPQVLRAKKRKQYYADPERYRQYTRDWNKRNPERIYASNRQSAFRLRQEILDHYGRECVCCGEIREVFLTLEHMNGSGGEHRRQVGNTNVYHDLKKRGFPQEGFEILCMNCNWGCRMGRVCPHKKERDALNVAPIWIIPIANEENMHGAFE